LHSGALCYFSGPHLGVINDNKLFKQYPPPLIEGEYLLGDKAYCDGALSHCMVYPIKASRSSELSDEERAYNELHGFYRASIEHAFGYSKRFRIIGMLIAHSSSHLRAHHRITTYVGTVYRGEPSFLQSVVKLILHVDAWYLSISPHRLFISIRELSIDVVRPVRPVPPVHDEGDNNVVDDNVVHEDDHAEMEQKYDDENDNDARDNERIIAQNGAVGEWEHVDTGNTFESFEMDDIVSAWFDTKFCEARIVEVDNENKCFTLHFFEDDQETANYEGRWMKHVFN
jgi:hypothetical protein